MLHKAWFRNAIATVGQKLPNDKVRKWETQSGKLAFKYYRAGFHLDALRTCYSVIIEEQSTLLPADATQENASSFYTGPMAEPLFFHLDAFFEAAKTSLDFTLTCLGSAGILASPPNSLHKYCSSAGNDSEIDREIRAVWTAWGKRTKAYRDCFSHHVALSGHIWQTAINMKRRDGAWSAHLYLPDNPDAQSYDAFSYNARIDALSLCSDVFEATGGLLEAVMLTCLKRHAADPREATDVLLTVRNVVVGD